MRPRGAIGQAGRAFGRKRATHLLAVLARHAHGGGHRHGRLAFNQHPPHQLGSTVRRQAGILMQVHPVPLGR